MTIIITKTKLAIAIVAMALIGATAAMAVDDNPFTDVPDSGDADAPFYSEPVEWLWDNGLTTGTTDTTFSPNDTVTRGQYAAFNFRYDQNIVQPALTAQQAEIDALEAGAAAVPGLFASDTEFGAMTNATATYEDLGLSATVTIPEGHTGVIHAIFSAESACFGGDGVGDWCQVAILRDGSVIDAADDAFDSTDGATETSASWEGHSMQRVTESLPAGDYVITVNYRSRDGSSSFRLDDMVLTAQVHLDS